MVVSIIESVCRSVLKGVSLRHCQLNLLLWYHLLLVIIIRYIFVFFITILSKSFLFKIINQHLLIPLGLALTHVLIRLVAFAASYKYLLDQIQWSMQFYLPVDILPLLKKILKRDIPKCVKLFVLDQGIAKVLEDVILVLKVHVPHPHRKV